MKNYPEKRSLVILGLIFLLLAAGIAVVGYLSYRNSEKQFRAQVQGQLTAIANLKETELLNWRNEIRFKPDAALTLRFPLAQTERPAVKAVLGQIGVVGYYGEPVLTNLRAIPGTPWFLVAEMDTTQLYAPLQEWLWQTIIFLGALLLVIGLGLALVWRQRNLRHYRQVEAVLSEKNQELQEMVRQLEQSQNMLQLVIESIPIRVFWKDGELCYLGCNSVFARDAGFSQPQQLLGKDDFAMGWKEQAELYRADDHLVMTSGHPKLNIVEPQTTPAGATIWLNTNKVPLQNADGEITGILGIYEDITERKQAEEALRQSEERHRIIAQLATDDVYVGWLFPDGRIESEWMTGALERITGYSPEEIKAWPNNLASIVIEQDRDKLIELQPRLLRHESVAVEVRIRCKNGDVRWLSNQIKPMPDKTRPPAIRLLSAVQDITERKQAEEALRQNEELYRTLVEALDVSLSRWLPDTTLVFANEKYRQVFGFQNRLTGQKWLDYLPEAAREETAAFYQDLARHPHAVFYERSVTASDGSVRHYQWIDTPILDAKGRAAVFQSAGFDLTERKHTEQLVQAQRDLARIIGTVTLAEDAWPLCLETMLWVSGMDSGGIYLFDGAGSALELVYQQGLGADFIQAVSRYPINTPSAQMVLAGVPLYFSAADLKQIHHQTEGLYALATIPIQYQGEVLGCFNIASHSLAQVPDFARHALEIIAPEIGNIIMYLRTASLLRESEEKYRSLVDSQDAAISTIDTEGVIHYMNSLGAIPLAGSPEAVIGRNLRDFFPPSIVEWQLDGIRQVIATGQGKVAEYQTMLADRPIWRRVSIQPVRDAAGQVALAMVNSVDITERKHLETALRQSEERYRIISGAVTDYAFSTRVDENGEFVMDWVAGAFEEITGYTFEEFVDRGGWQASLHPDDLYIDNHIREELGSNRSAVGEMRIFSKSGQIVHLRLYARPVWAERENKLKAIYGAVQNITERKQAEHALRESEERLRQITSSLREVIWLRDAQTRQVLYVNPAFEELTGWTCENFYENRDILADAIYPDDRERMIKALEQRSESIPFYQEHRLVHRDGSIRWVSSRSFPVRDTAGMVYRWVTNMEDITERKQAEAELQRLEKRYRALIEHAPDGIVLLGEDGKLKYISPSTERLFGYLSDENLNLDPAELTHPDDRSGVIAALTNLMRDPSQRPTLEYRFLHQNGDWRWVQSTFSNLLTVPNVEAIVINFKDVTERKQAEEAQRESDERFRTLYETMVQGIVYQDAAGSIISANPAAERILGLTLDQMQGLSSIDPRWRSIHEDGTDFSGETHPAMVALRTGKPVNNVVMGVFHPQTEQYVWININAAPQFKPGQTKPYQVYALFEDITARKQNQDLVLARLRLIEFAGTHTVKELLQATLDEAGVLISSPIGFYHFVDPDQNTLTLQAWSTRTRKEFCNASGEDSHYPVNLAGVWADCLRQRRPITHNDYATLENRRGLPAGHAELVREVVVPIIRGDRVVAILGVGNKPTNYTPTDLEIINTFADMSWDIVERKRAEQDLVELNRTLEARVTQRTAEVQDLYDNAPTGYHSLDKNGVFLMMNQTELNWLGYTREEVVGIKSFRDLITPQSQQIFVTTFPLLKNQGWVKDLEFDMVRKDGSLLPVLLNATAIYDNDGNYSHSRTTIFDNTERKKAETALRESEEQNRLLFEESPDAVILFDELGRVVRTNRAGEILTGYSPEQLTGRTWDELGLLPGEQVEQLAGAIVQALQLTEHFAAAEFRLQRADGVTCAVGARVFALEIRGRQHYLTTMRDITTEKQAEDTLRLANAELARAARSKDEFLANMSHELRTPLNAILGFSEALLEQVRGPLNERQQASLRNIEASGRHLLALISDILDLSKVEAGRLELLLEVVPVADICQTSLLFVKEVALKKQLQLAFHLDNQMAKVQADPKRLKQMLVNLLSNAVKFTPEGGQVSLEVTTDAEAGVIHFAVQDSGIGIPPQEMARLFQPFTQLDSSLSRQYEGTGLGLALVRRLAELHSGSVTVESEGVPGRGSRFTIALPNPTLQRTEPKLLERKTGTGPLQTALVVEDSESAAEQLERYLQEAKIRVAVHPQGEGVLNQAVRLSPGVIFLDLLMPGQTGWEVLAQLKADPRTQDIPVIIVSVVDERAKGLAAGAVEYLVKPISRETLRQVMSAVVGTPESVREALVIVSETGRIRARILLAEDNEINIEVINEYLQDEGYRVVLARNGREALAQATEIRPDLILMDIQMPEMDGLEAIRRLRAKPEFAATPIIALTALAMPGDRERCLDAGATEYITKPVSLKRLVELIEELLKHQA